MTGAVAVRRAASPKPTARGRGRDDDIRPDETPEMYASVCRGKCLEPVYFDGACLVFSKSAPVKAGDFVGVWFKPGVMPADEPQRWVKRLAMGLLPGMTFPYTGVGPCEPIIMVEMLNPPKRFAFPASQILAIHKVVGVATPDGNGMARMEPPASEH